MAIMSEMLHRGGGLSRDSRSKWAVPDVCFFKPVMGDSFSQNLVTMKINDPVIGNLLLPLPWTN